jgi:hypothetical protein
MAWRWLVWVVAIGLVGCDGKAGDTSAEDSGDTNGEDATDADGDDDTVGDASSGDPPGPLGQCRGPCTVGTDCCPDPENCFAQCLQGYCYSAACDPESCATGCHPLYGVSSCLRACDEHCGQPNSEEGCRGMADDGTPFCIEPCGSAFVGTCPEPLTCDEVTGMCACVSDDDCGGTAACRVG